jgi:hypothetical protein
MPLPGARNQATGHYSWPTIEGLKKAACCRSKSALTLPVPWPIFPPRLDAGTCPGLATKCDRWQGPALGTPRSVRFSCGPPGDRLAWRPVPDARALRSPRNGLARCSAVPSNRSRKYRVRAPLGPVIFGGFFMRWRQGRSRSLLPVSKRLELDVLLSRKLARRVWRHGVFAQ